MNCLTSSSENMPTIKEQWSVRLKKGSMFHTLEELSQSPEQAAAIEAEQALHRQTKDIVTRLDKLETLITEKFEEVFQSIAQVKMTDVSSVHESFVNESAGTNN